MGLRIEYQLNQKIGDCLFIRDTTSTSPRRRAIFRCECGKELEADIMAIKFRRIISCGCKNDAARIRVGKLNKTHGQSRGASPHYCEYTIWTCMIQRCYNKNSTPYKDYGGRGITVCDRWKDSFESFLADMGPRPSKKHSIDRIDNNLGYSKDNCKWSTFFEQANNKRNNNIVTYNGITLTLPQWARIKNISASCIERRLYKRGWSVEKALNTPSAALTKRIATIKYAFGYIGIVILFFLPFIGYSQSETHNFTTYDTTISLANGLGTPYYNPWQTDVWVVRISRPIGMFTPGSPDTASRPAIITMPGQGEQGTLAAATAGVLAYGPHYFLNSGKWDGSVVLGTTVHYPILITIAYVNGIDIPVTSYYVVVNWILTHYHIKPNAVHLGGLSEGAFSEGGLIEYENKPGDQAGMKMITSMVVLEGTPNPPPAFQNAISDTIAYKIWAAKYHGRLFALEGSTTDNFRDEWHYSVAMNDSVPGSAYFSYTNAAGGGHGGWNSEYDPTATNWTSVGTLGPLNAPSQAGTNTMGDYQAPESIFQWMLRQGDTTLVGASPVIVPPKCPICPSPTIQRSAIGFSFATKSGVVIVDSVYYNDGTSGSMLP